MAAKKMEMFEMQVNPVYAAMVETMDTNVGRLMAKLKAQGIDDDTLILFTGDNGGDIVNSLRERLETWRRETTANMPRPKP